MSPWNRICGNLTLPSLTKRLFNSINNTQECYFHKVTLFGNSRICETKTPRARRMSSKPATTRVHLISCGSFNPITIMHLRMFELAKDHFEKVLSNDTIKYVVDQGIISPTNDKYGEKKNLLKAAVRVQMVQIAIKSCHVDNWIKVDDWETQQNDWVRTLASLEHQKQVLEQDSKNRGLSVPKVMLLCGADLIESFNKPGLWDKNDLESIVRDFGLVVITRSGSDPHEVIGSHEVLSKYQNNVQIVQEWIGNEISATKIRLAVKNGLSIKYFVPDDVIEFIRTNKLYQE